MNTFEIITACKGMDLEGITEYVSEYTKSQIDKTSALDTLSKYAMMNGELIAHLCQTLELLNEKR